MLKSTDSASFKPTSACYAESFVQRESHALSTNLPVLYRNVEIWKKDCLVIMPLNLAVLHSAVSRHFGKCSLEKSWINQRSSLHNARG